MNDRYGMGVVEDENGFALPEDLDEYGDVLDLTGPQLEDGVSVDPWAVNHADDEQTIKDALPPKGWYKVQLTPGERAFKEVDGVSLPNQGYFGIGVLEEGEVQHNARIRTAICPRKFIRATGKTHWAYLQYIGLAKAFKEAIKREHETYDELEAFLADNPIEARVSHTKDNDYMVNEYRACKTDVSF